MIPTIGEVGASFGPCNEEVTSLLSCPHDVCVDRVPLTVAIKKVGFHGKNSELGDKAPVI